MPRYGGVRKSKTDAIRVRNRMNAKNTKIRKFHIGKVKAGWVVYRRRAK